MIDSIETALLIIKEQTGLELKADDYFNGFIVSSKEELYFNIMLKKRTSESLEFTKLKRFSENCTWINRIEPNGLNRVAIFFV